MVEIFTDGGKFPSLQCSKLGITVISSIVFETYIKVFSYSATRYNAYW